MQREELIAQLQQAVRESGSSMDAAAVAALLDQAGDTKQNKTPEQPPAAPKQPTPDVPHRAQRPEPTEAEQFNAEDRLVRKEARNSIFTRKKPKDHQSREDFMIEIRTFAADSTAEKQEQDDPQRDARLSASLKGEVRRSTGVFARRVMLLVLVIGFCLLCLMLTHLVLFWLPVLLTAVLLLLQYLHHSSWRLSFDGATGWFRYTDSGGAATSFHISEIFDTRYEQVAHGDKLYDRILILSIDGMEISVNTGTYRCSNDEPVDYSIRADSGHQKLEDYLGAYRRAQETKQEVT